MKYYIIAGEASGDLHGSNLMKQLALQDKSAEFRFWGGDKMAETGGKPVKHIRDLAFMGFTEVIGNLKTILNNISFCEKDILEFKPDALILIDYPGFNLRIAKKIHGKNIKVFYYISPQVWAWKQSRVHTIKKVVDRMFVILPFEKDFYAKFDMDVDFVGHPLLDAITIKSDKEKEELKTEWNLHGMKTVALLPGSRKQEISKMLPLMLKMKTYFPEIRFIIAGAPSIDADFYKKFILDDTHIVYNRTYDILSIADVALVTSGTATLETALFDVPEVVCYRGSGISYQIAKKLIKVKYISLVNLIMDKPVIKELIQHDLTEEKLSHELNALLNDSEYRQQLKTEFNSLRIKLGGGGASEVTASLMLKTLNGR
jgi:lipid-A-disaccharide synthase